MSLQTLNILGKNWKLLQQELENVAKREAAMDRQMTELLAYFSAIAEQEHVQDGVQSFPLDHGIVAYIETMNEECVDIQFEEVNQQEKNKWENPTIYQFQKKEIKHP